MREDEEREKSRTIENKRQILIALFRSIFLLSLYCRCFPSSARIYFRETNQSTDVISIFNFGWQNNGVLGESMKMKF